MRMAQQVAYLSVPCSTLATPPLISRHFSRQVRVARPRSSRYPTHHDDEGSRTTVLALCLMASQGRAGPYAGKVDSDRVLRMAQVGGQLKVPPRACSD